MSSFLKKLSIEIEKGFYEINRVTPVQVWYLILLLTILGSVFFSSSFGPEVNSTFAFLWLFALVMVIFKGDGPPKTDGDSYIGLFFGVLLVSVFIVLVITSVLHYFPI
jgi:hypothetical protein